MREMSVHHQQATQLLHNKFVVVLGDSIQRSVYKDLVVMLQKDKYLSLRQLRCKGEMSFEQDCLIEGGCLSQMTNGTQYKEVRQFQSDHHLVRFYFVTRIFSRYMESIIQDFRNGLKPDVVIVNSCVWDISRYNSSWIDDYKKNLYRFFDELSECLPEETLVIWNLTMPLGAKIKGGFLVPEIEHKAPQLRYDVVEANFFSGTLANAFEMDVLDLHFQFRSSLHHRTNDGVHWNAIAHRRITSLLLQHIAQAWGVILPCPPITVGEECHSTAVTDNGRKGFFSNPLSLGNLKSNRQQPYLFEAPSFAPALIPQLLPVQGYPYQYIQDGLDFSYRLPHHFEPYREDHHQYVMRSRHTRHQYIPYTHHRPKSRQGRY